MKLKSFSSILILSCIIATAFWCSVFNPEYSLFNYEEVLRVPVQTWNHEFELPPGNYMLRVKTPANWAEPFSVKFNGSNAEAHKSKVRATRNFSFYNLGMPIQQKANTISIDFGSKRNSGKVYIQLTNYRKSLWSGQVISFLKPSLLPKISIIQTGTAFLITFLILCGLTLVFKAHNAILDFIFTSLRISGLVLLSISIFSALPFTDYALSMKLSGFCTTMLFLPILVPLVLLVLSFQKISQNESITPDSKIFGFRVFLLFFVILALLRTGTVLFNLVPLGHDTLQYLQLQYNIFFNEIPRDGLPQWLPFMTHGTVSHVWFLLSQNLLCSALVPFSKFISNMNFYVFFQAGLLLDEVVLLIGCILFAKRIFRQNAVIIFVTSSIVMTTISSVQIWYDFHLVYFVPLVLYCLDRAIREASAWYLFLCGLFSVGMLLGNLPYFPPLLAFTICVFLICVFGFFPAKTIKILRNFVLNLNWRHIPAVIIPCCFAGFVYYFMHSGLGEIISYNVGRTENWDVNNLELFLNYGGYTNVSKYLELINRGTNNLDNTIYGGLLIVPFIMLAILRVRNRISYVFATTSFIMVCFSVGFIIPIIFYYAFPLGKFYRHVGLIAPLAKVFFVFYAGFGFWEFWNASKNQEETANYKRNFVIVFTVLLYIFVLAMVHKTGLMKIYDFPKWTDCISDNQLYVFPEQVSKLMREVLLISGIGILLILLGLTKPVFVKPAVIALLLLHVTELTLFKKHFEYNRLARVDRSFMSVFDKHDYNFPENRTQHYYDNERFSFIMPYLYDKGTFQENIACPTVGRFGAYYWNMESFIFADVISSVFRTDHWLKGVDAFYSSFVPLSKRDSRHVGFPIPDSRVFKKLCGNTEPKLQLYSKIHRISNESRIKTILADPNFAGDMLLVFDANSPIKEIQGMLEANDRIYNPAIKVQEFTFNRLEVSVQNPNSTEAGLYYADAWHPCWNATVNGKPTMVYKANLAYKAVLVPPGKSRVIFSVGNSHSKLLFAGMVGIGICTLCGVLIVLITDIRKPD